MIRIQMNILNYNIIHEIDRLHIFRLFTANTATTNTSNTTSEAPP